MNHQKLTSIESFTQRNEAKTKYISLCLALSYFYTVNQAELILKQHRKKLNKILLIS